MNTKRGSEKSRLPMKIIALLCLLLAPAFGAPQNPPPAQQGAGAAELEAVLSQMDRSAATFESAQAEFQWDNYQKVVDETERQTGQVFFRRAGGNVEAMFDITAPTPKQVLFKDGMLILFDKKIDQVTQHKTENKTDVEAFLGLGFGARGHDLLKSYDVKMDGWETVDGVKTAKLELVAKSEKVRNMFSRFILWIDPKEDIPRQQKVLQPNGDFWFAHYLSFNLNSKIAKDTFHLKTTSHTKVITQ